MKFIAHRGLWKDRSSHNTFSALKAAFDRGLGVETDVRSFCGRLYLSHDPIASLKSEVEFKAFLELASKYPGLPLFFNIKEDGLLPLLRQHTTALSKLNTIFFDMSVPELIQYAKEFPPSMLATRLSDYEPFPAALNLCEWIWVDGFSQTVSIDVLKPLHEKGKRLAFVSPELHGRESASFFRALNETPWLNTSNFYLCTDLVEKFSSEIL